MGHHATIGTRLTSAPRVSVTDRITGTAQQRIAAQLAGPVFTSHTDPIWSETALMLAMHLAGRKITRITETVNSFRKDGQNWELKLSQFNARIIVRKSNTKHFTGWYAMLVPFGQKTGNVIAKVAKGTAIETNGERQDCCRAAMNKLQALLFTI
jgi:hypothetical protein